MDHQQPLGIIILAAGKGTRMASDLPKVLHQVNGQTMLESVLDTAQNLNPEKMCVVVGYEGQKVQEACKHITGIEWVTQKPLMGTGHAVQFAAPVFQNFAGDIAILYGDVPAITSSSLRQMQRLHIENRATATLMTAVLDHPHGYGRIVKDAQGNVEAIREEKDATEAQRKITEINTGICMFNAQFLTKSIFELENHNEQKEYYLTDLIEIAVKKGLQVQAYQLKDPSEAHGVNDPEALKKAEEILKNR